MKRILVTMVFAALLFGAVAPASAFEACFAISGFGNLWRFEFTQHGSFFAMNGRERQFAERAAGGTTYVEPGGTAARLGFTTYADGVALFIDGMITLGVGSGPFSSVVNGSTTSTPGTISVVSCTSAIAGEPVNGLPDIFGK